MPGADRRATCIAGGAWALVSLMKTFSGGGVRRYMILGEGKRSLDKTFTRLDKVGVR